MFSRVVAVMVMVVALGSVGSVLLAQDQPANGGAAPMAPPKPNDKYDVIKMAEWDFLYGNGKDWEEGIGYLQQMCREKLDPFQAQWRDEKWRTYACNRLYETLQIMFDRKQYDLCDRAALYGTILGATQLPWLEKYQEMRIQARLKQGKAGEALPLAKSYYDACSMAKTSTAIDLVCTCLMEDSKISDAAGTVRKFRMYQMKGAAAPASADGAAPAKEKSVLDDVKVDGAEYQKTADQLKTKETYLRLIDGGNLMLLADQPAAARALFNKAYAIASESQLAEASEAVARSMRAEDGTVGRANAWILKQRTQQADAK